MPKEIILTSDVPGLGQVGDLKKVKDGYARNYLLPHRFAVLATSNAVKKFEHQKEKIEIERKKRFEGAQSMAEKISKVGLVFERPVGPGGRLFGSVTPYDIAGELGKNGISIEKKSVLMDSPLKTLGDHTIRVRIHSKVVVDIPVKINALELKKERTDAGVETEEKELN